MISIVRDIQIEERGFVMFSRVKELIMVMVITVATVAYASTETIGGITWGYTVNDSAAVVTSASSTSGSLIIPSRLGGYSVTLIGKYAFEGCSGLTSVSIPDSVTSIGNYAFRVCSGLTSVFIGNVVSNKLW